LKQRYSLFQNASNEKGQNEPTTQIGRRPRALVFAHYRDSARKVVEILNEGGIKAAPFVGQAKREFDIGMSQEEQSNPLEMESLMS
jgi:ERCC4-related helicase